MTAARILILATYPCAVPRHGGQIRLAEIIAAYRRAGHQVQSLSVYEKTSYQEAERGPDDFDYPGDSAWRRWRGQAIPLIDDLTAGQFVAGDEAVYQALTAAVQGVPDIIHLEQPWLWPLAARWRREGRFARACLVYGSQNLEAPLKLAILRQYGISQAEEIAADIAALEHNACQQADLVLAVSASDQQQLSQHASGPVLLVANGISPGRETPAARSHWQKQVPTAPFPLFIGSAHPPNIAGFFACLGDALGFLAPDTRLCVIGSVGAQLLVQAPFQRWAPLNQSRLQVFGLVDDEALAAIKALAHVFILPITEGGGSNIKTAEALYSGRHVLGTPVSLRGFEAWTDLPGVHVAAPGRPFIDQLQALLQTPLPQRSADEQARCQQLLWSHTLTSMLDALPGLLAGTPAHP